VFWNPIRIAAAFLLAACPAVAQHDPWTRVSSPHFELFTTAGERSGRDLVRHFERVRSFFMQAFGAEEAKLPPTRIIAFQSEAEFRPYRPSSTAAAFFHRGPNRDYIVMQDASEESYPTAVHEYTHLLVGIHWPTAPVWFNEGLAELYSTAKFKREKLIIGDPPGNAQRVLRSAQWIGLQQLFHIDGHSPEYHDVRDVHMLYAESWAMVHMLLLDKAYSGNRRAAIEALQKSPAEIALPNVYRKPLARIEADLQDRAFSYAVPVAAYDVTLPKADLYFIVFNNAATAARAALSELAAEQIRSTPRNPSR